MNKIKQLWIDALFGGIIGIFTIGVFLVLYVSRNGLEAVNNSLLILLVLIPLGSILYTALKAMIER